MSSQEQIVDVEGRTPEHGDDPTGPAVSARALTIGLCTVVVAIAFEVIAVATALPVAARDVDGLPYYAWLFSLFVIGMLFSTVVTGRLSDRVGPARPMIVGLVVFAVGLVVAASAFTMGQLVLGRLVQGLGSGAINTASLVLIAQAMAPAQRPRMFTYISAAWVVPSFVGPPVSAWLTATLSWHWVFLAVLPLLVVGGAMITPTLVRLLRQPHPTPTDASTDAPVRKPAPLWAAGLVAVSAAMLQYAGQRLDLLALALAVVGLVGLAIGVPPLMPRGFVRLGRGLPAVILTRTLLPGAFVGAEAFVPLMLVEQRGVPLIYGGVTLTIGSVGWMTASWLQSQRWMHLRRNSLITLGAASVAAGIACCALVAWLPAVWFGVVGVGWLFCGFGMGLATASTSLVTMTLSERALQGRNASSLNLGDALGTSLFVGVSGTVFAALRSSGDLSLTFGAVMVTMVGVAILAGAASLRIGRVA